MIDDRDTEWVTVDAILATDELLPAYGGFKLAREALDRYAESFMRRDHLTIAHDSTRPIAIRNVVAGVRLNAAGNNEVWASFEAAADGWAEFEAERIAHGAPGGFSFTYAERYGEVRAHRPGQQQITVSADAHHFSPDDLATAAMALGPIADVDVNRLYQFSHVPPARAIVEFGIGLLESIPADLLASFLYDCIKVFIFRRKQAGGSTTVEMLVYDDGDSRRTTMSVTTDSELVALEALRAGMAIATQPGRYVWRNDDHSWSSW